MTPLAEGSQSLYVYITPSRVNRQPSLISSALPVDLFNLGRELDVDGD